MNKNAINEAIGEYLGWVGTYEYTDCRESMDAAESTIDTKSLDVRSLYHDLLCCAVGVETDDFAMAWKLLRCKPVHRAEAFCKTFGIWKEEWR